jgi:excinuclease ABC subunit C
MKKTDLKKFKLAKEPGVYFFLRKKEILYIGKATNLSDRVKSYFLKDLINSRGPLILDMVTQSTSIKYQKTDSILEALILEANLIKKHQPKYNTKEKDNKSFNYVCITKEDVPKVLIKRGRNLINRNTPPVFKEVFGPFPSGIVLKEAMKIVRRIFPYVDEQSSKKNNAQFYSQLGLSPDTQKIKIDILAYRKNIKNLVLFFQGKKKNIVKNLRKEMMNLAKNKEFEKANEVKKKIFALNHINDIALLKEESKTDQIDNLHFKIEAYDIAHMSGKNMVGAMVVVEDKKLNKNKYRKFIIRTVDRADDTKALAEILERRFMHNEWNMPDLIVVDGSLAQINRAKQVLKNIKISIPVVSVVKDDRHKAKMIIGNEKIINEFKKEILLANTESHRFAVNFHKQKRNKTFINKITPKSKSFFK